MSTLARGEELVAKLEAAGIRATVDPALASPPCVLVIPPNLTYDLPCGATLRWQLVAIVPAAQTADRSSWEALDILIDATASVADVATANLVTYVVNGHTYPAYLMTWEEAYSWQ